jgi:predicted phosphodiesterase
MRDFDWFTLLRSRIMRLLVTADLHYNHPKSRALADELIDRMNLAARQEHVDALLLIGDTASFDGPSLDTCLQRFDFSGAKLFVAGNHELWTRGADSYAIFREQLPARVRALGWRWLQAEPFVMHDIAIVGSVGWYDYSFAQPSLQIPRRFYAAKVSPGAAARLAEHAPLLAEKDDIPAYAHEIVARWNDGTFVKLHRDDEQFLEELLVDLKAHLDALHGVRQILAAIHHLPFAQLLPPPHSAQWDFAKAYLGSERIGQLLLSYPNVRTVLCGHSHFAMEAKIEHIRAINIGSGYRAKRFRVVDL